MFKKRFQSQGEEDENPFLLSFSDLMACLLAIFILALVVTLFELEKRRAELRVSKSELIGSLEGIQFLQENIVSALGGISNREQNLTLMLAEIQTELKLSNVRVVIAENGTVLRIPEQQLQFALGKYDIPTGGPAYAIGKALLQALQSGKNRAMLDTVFIEGHTDSVPNSREMGNWGLSTYRAISLWNYWTVSPGQFSELKNLQTIPIDKSQPKPLFSVSGYADTRSTIQNIQNGKLKDDRPEDRRIDIRFTLVSSEKKDLASLQEDVDKLREKTSALIINLKAFDHGR
jgi:hypothetical protein